MDKFQLTRASALELDTSRTGKVSSYGLDLGKQRSGRIFSHMLGVRKHEIEKISTYLFRYLEAGFWED